MGTIFAIIDKSGETLEIAKRGGTPFFRWLNDAETKLKGYPNSTEVFPIDNGPQGIDTLGDIRKEIRRCASEIKKREKLIKKVRAIMTDSVERIGKSFGVEIGFEIMDESYDGDINFEGRMVMNFDGDERKREFNVRESFRQGLNASHGWTSPAYIKADLIQSAVTGRVAEHLFKINKATGK